MNAPRKVTCHHCEGSGCTHCELERRAAAGGEQGLTAAELEFDQMRAELIAARLAASGGLGCGPGQLPGLITAVYESLRLERDEARAQLAEAREDRDEAQRAAAWAQKERDAALAQLSLLSKGGAA